MELARMREEEQQQRAQHAEQGDIEGVDGLLDDHVAGDRQVAIGVGLDGAGLVEVVNASIFEMHRDRRFRPIQAQMQVKPGHPQNGHRHAERDDQEPGASEAEHAGSMA